jgi:DNA-binding NarL/FixJ family response regulator
MRALIVEDEKTPRELLRDLVPWSSHGFTRVDTARNGLEALALLEGGEVDLVLTDVRMPKMDGVELALEVRRRWPDCVLLFLSGFSDKEYLKTAIRVQAQDYLDKPIDLALVGQAVSLAAQTLGERRSVREVSQREEQALRNLAPLRRQALAQGLVRGEAFSVPPEDRFSDGPLRVLAATGLPQRGPGTGGFRSSRPSTPTPRLFPPSSPPRAGAARWSSWPTEPCRPTRPPSTGRWRPSWGGSMPKVCPVW